jgi:hypothetical protein
MFDLDVGVDWHAGPIHCDAAESGAAMGLDHRVWIFRGEKG